MSDILIQYLRKRKKKRFFRSVYLDIKKKVIDAIVELDGASYGVGENLLNPVEFKNYFRDQGWYRICNILRDRPRIIKELSVCFGSMKDNVLGMLNVVGDEWVKGDRAFKTLYYFSEEMRKYQELSSLDVASDEYKWFMSFLWRWLAGWSFIDGHAGSDVIFASIRKM